MDSLIASRVQGLHHFQNVGDLVGEIGLDLLHGEALGERVLDHAALQRELHAETPRLFRVTRSMGVPEFAKFDHIGDVKGGRCGVAVLAPAHDSKDAIRTLPVLTHGCRQDQLVGLMIATPLDVLGRRVEIVGGQHGAQGGQELKGAPLQTGRMSLAQTIEEITQLGRKLGLQLPQRAEQRTVRPLDE